MAGSKIWGWYKTGELWVPIQVDASGKLIVASVDDAEISQDTPEDLKHLPHGYYAAGPSYLPFKVDADGVLQVNTGALAHLGDIGDVNVPTPSDDDVLYWDDAASKWQAKVNWVAAHKASHENGGADEISVADLSGELADDQPPKVHGNAAHSETYLKNVVEDVTPQLGADLDSQNHKLTNLLGLLIKTATELTIDTGVITVTQMFHTVDTEADAASDDLATINGGATVNMIVIKAANDGRTVVVKHNTGNIWLQGKADISLDDLEDGLLLVWSGSKWFDIAAGGAVGVTTKIQDADGDTSWDVEEAADEDKVHGKVKGVEAFLLNNDGVLDLAKQTSAKGYRSTAQSIPEGVWTKVDCDAVVWDIQGDFDITTNHRFDVAVTGRYLITAQASMEDMPADSRMLVGIRQNGDEKATGRMMFPWIADGDVTAMTILELTAGDYLELWVRQDNAAAKGLWIAHQWNHLIVHKLS